MSNYGYSNYDGGGGVPADPPESSAHSYGGIGDSVQAISHGMGRAGLHHGTNGNNNGTNYHQGQYDGGGGGGRPAAEPPLPRAMSRSRGPCGRTAGWWCCPPPPMLAGDGRLVVAIVELVELALEFRAAAGLWLLVAVLEEALPLPLRPLPSPLAAVVG
mmetsp:Transcript_24488/g.70590  ORF Transcript_24488/g.70590 Transcript_24488/m.70590 type:complete len:159 (+) Transcript_24488:327-803(+)